MGEKQLQVRDRGEGRPLRFQDDAPGRLCGDTDVPEDVVRLLRSRSPAPMEHGGQDRFPSAGRAEAAGCIPQPKIRRFHARGPLS